MGRVYSALRTLLLGMSFVLCASLFVAPAGAAAQTGFAPGSVCYASADLSETYAAIANQPARWVCKGDSFDTGKQRHFVRHDLRGRSPADPKPHYFEFDRHPFGQLTLTVFGTDGEIKSRTYTDQDLAVGNSSLRSIAGLPDSDAPIVAMVATLDGGEYPEALVHGSLRDKPSVRILAGLPHLLAALICGLLIAPMLFDLGYYRALREPFPLFHALFCVMAFIQTAAVSGLIPLFMDIPFRAEMVVTYLSLDVMVAANFLFAYHFVERSALRRWQRRVLGWLVAITLVNGTVTTFWAAEIGALVDHIYLGVFMLCLTSYFYVLYHARRRGSRAAGYLFFGLAPFSLVTMAQLMLVYFPIDTIVFDETWPQNLALLFEVVATALAVADRFISVRRERDKAVDEARILSALSEHDDLTGLLNRRALDAHYPKLLADGFTSLALIDLDHFKSINDIHGHPVGDAVLRCAAGAIEAGDERDVRSFRIGGEEFLLLLRGPHAEQRAEQRRRAISTRVSTDIQALDRPVTASMGFVEFASVAGEEALDFSALYSRADWLLYEAKRQGRNRTLSETLRHFEPERKRGWAPDTNAA